MQNKLEELLIGDTLNDPNIEKYTGLNPLSLRKFLRSKLPITTSLCKMNKDWFLTYNKEYKNPKDKFNYKNLVVAEKRKKGTLIPCKEDVLKIKDKLRKNIALTDIVSEMSRIDIETLVAIKQRRICDHI